MNRRIAKYFWALNEKALKETERILKNPNHPRFPERLVTLLSRCGNPREVFSIVPRGEFVENWPKVRRYWRRIAGISDFRDWWQTIYEELAQPTGRKRLRTSSAAFLKIGKLIRKKRIERDWTQNELALRTGIKQSDISRIEQGKKNITLGTLIALSNALKIKKIEL